MIGGSVKHVVRRDMKQQTIQFHGCISQVSHGITIQFHRFFLVFLGLIDSRVRGTIDDRVDIMRLDKGAYRLKIRYIQFFDIRVKHVIQQRKTAISQFGTQLSIRTRDQYICHL